MWRRGEVVITTSQFHSTKPELRFCAGSNPARGLSDIRNSKDIWEWSRLEIRRNTFCRSTISQNNLLSSLSCYYFIIWLNIFWIKDYNITHLISNVWGIKNFHKMMKLLDTWRKMLSQLRLFSFRKDIL